MDLPHLNADPPGGHICHASARQPAQAVGKNGARTQIQPAFPARVAREPNDARRSAKTDDSQLSRSPLGFHPRKYRSVTGICVAFHLFHHRGRGLSLPLSIESNGWALCSRGVHLDTTTETPDLSGSMTSRTGRCRINPAFRLTSLSLCVVVSSCARARADAMFCLAFLAAFARIKPKTVWSRILQTRLTGLAPFFPGFTASWEHFAS